MIQFHKNTQRASIPENMQWLPKTLQNKMPGNTVDPQNNKTREHNTLINNEFIHYLCIGLSVGMHLL